MKWHGVSVEDVCDRLSDLELVERGLRRVERDVAAASRGCEVQLATLRGVGHAAVLPNSRYDALAVTLPIPNRAGASV